MHCIMNTFSPSFSTEGGSQVSHHLNEKHSSANPWFTLGAGHALVYINFVGSEDTRHYVIEKSLVFVRTASKKCY